LAVGSSAGRGERGREISLRKLGSTFRDAVLGQELHGEWERGKGKQGHRRQIRVYNGLGHWAERCWRQEAIGEPDSWPAVGELILISNHLAECSAIALVERKSRLASNADPEMAEDLEARFKKAVWLVRNGPKLDSTNEQKLAFYKFYKQVWLSAPCLTP
jgi:hypothetical protein